MREITLICGRAQDFIGGFLPLLSLLSPRSAVRLWRPLLITTLMATACGRQEPSPPPERPILPILAVRDAPQEYSLADPGCQTETSERKLSSTTVTDWNGAEAHQHTVSLTDTLTRRTLVNPAVARTTFGEELERQCEGSIGPSQACLNKNLAEPGWNTVTLAKDLRICRDGHEFGRQTYEGVALTSAFYIQKAWERYRSVNPEHKAPDAVVLSVLPHFTDLYVTQNLQGQSVRIKRYMTHNLAYFPDGETIVVFPESQKRAETAQGYLWESGFVLAHEYGHHIDFERHGLAYRAGGLRYDPVLHVLMETDPPPNDSDLYQGLEGPYESRRSLLGSALAEGFADLLAYYTDGANGQSVVGLPGIGISRDVGSRYFGDGLAKTLTDEQLQVFFREKKGRDALTNSSRFTDVHTIGAIFAFAADQIFTRVLKAYSAPAPQSRAGIDQRYLLTLQWMDKVTSMLSNLGPNTDRQELVRSVSLAFETTIQRHLTSFPLDEDGTRQTSAEVKRDLCLTFEAILPGLGSLPFADARESCPLL